MPPFYFSLLLDYFLMKRALTAFPSVLVPLIWKIPALRLEMSILETVVLLKTQRPCASRISNSPETPATEI